MEPSAGRLKMVTQLALCLFLVPLLGWGTGWFSEASYDKKFRELIVTRLQMMSNTEFDARKMGYVSHCDTLATRPESAKEAEALCGPAREIGLVKLASYGTAAIGVILLALILGARAMAGTDRERMSAVFGPLIRAVMVLLAVSVLAQGALFVYSIYTIESILIQRIHAVALVAVAVGALVGCWTLLRAAIGVMKQEPTQLRAIQLQKADHPGVFAFVEGIASQLKAEMPDHIVVGLEPNFFVTAADVKLLGDGKVLQGRTLFMSLGLLRIFTRSEMAAVIGHELGHFRGGDVTYSMKFAPMYARLGQAIAKLGDSSAGATGKGKVPAVIALSYCMHEFASAERSVGRERELLADQAGAEAADARSLATALVKVSLFGLQWGPVTSALTDAMAKGNYFPNMSLVYADQCRSTSESIHWDDARSVLGKTVMSHPVDTHPPLTARLQSLDTSLADISLADIAPAGDSASAMIEGVEKLEQDLSSLEARWHVAIGSVVVPPEGQRDARAAGEPGP